MSDRTGPSDRDAANPWREPVDEPAAATRSKGANTADGNSIVAASWIGTVVFGVTSALGAAAEQLDTAALVVALAMFTAGTIVFFVAFARAVTRSRTDEIGVMNLFFLDRSAPRPVRRSLLASLGVEIATAVAAAAARPNTSLAFGILAPVYALSLMGLYGARHGVFPKR